MELTVFYVLVLEENIMNIVKLILKIILTIIRIPFTIWYVVMGLLFWVFFLICKCFKKIESILGIKDGSMDLPKGIEVTTAVLTFEWASLVKFYHFHW